jgi:hypothetical protein
MSGSDEQERISKDDLPIEGAPGSDPLAASSSEDLSAEPPAFVLPSIAIPPPKAINAPASRALASGDDLIDLAIDPLGPKSLGPNFTRRVPLPDPVETELFAPTQPESGSNPSASHRSSAFTPGDRLTEALRSDADAASDETIPAFPITPITPFAAPAHAEPVQVDATPTESAPQQPQINPTPDTRYPTPDPRHPIPNTQPETRIPNFGHVFILVVIALFGFVAAGLFVGGALHFQLWGVKTGNQAVTDIHYTLASMAVLYVFSFGCAWFLFPRLWHKPFFAGLQWNAAAAVRYRHWLFAAASFCFVLAVVDEFLLPGPTNAPIDKLFSNTAAAWLLFAFGVTVAPFFEELTFRGFLLPALCTAVDWTVSLRTRKPPPPLGPNGHPQWSLAAMIVGSVLTSLPFAAMHADQTGYSLGPFVLLFCVSLILCFARLATRSLAASTLVHAVYNFILFTLMLVGTSGFKHLDKM